MYMKNTRKVPKNWQKGEKVQIIVHLVYERHHRDMIENPTTAIVKTQTFDALALPMITFCPDEGFKEKGFFYRLDDFERNKYKLQDIFSEEFLEKLNKSDKIVWKETWSLFKGACYSFESQELHKALDVHGFTFYIKKTAPDLNVLIHEKGYEMWVLEYNFPVLIDFLDLEIASKPDYAIVEVLLRKTEYTNLEFCSPQDFNECSKKALLSEMKKKGLTCLPSYFWQALGRETFSICTEKSQALESLQTAEQILLDFLKQPANFGCLKPCKKTSYNPHLSHIHQKGEFRGLHENSVILSIAFGTTTVIAHSEYLLYNFANIFSAIGGSMGLLLGWSIYSIFNFFIEFLFNSF